MNKKFISYLCLTIALTSSAIFTGCSSLKYNNNTKEDQIVETSKPLTKETFNSSQEKIINEYTANTKNPSKDSYNNGNKTDITKETTNPTEDNDDKNKDLRKENKEKTPTTSTENTSEKIDVNNLKNTKISWWFKPNKNHITPEVNDKLGFDLTKYDGCYVGDTTRKVLYLTFDEGYENGYTGKILDTLKENDVKAIFFVTLPYLKGNPDLIARMVEEGHIVANHTNHHPSMPSVTGNEEKFNKEFKDVEDEYKKITGKDMVKYFRPPMGEFSEKSIAMTKNLGYKSVFWSFAYFDWDINKQPDPTKAKKTISDGLHPGCVMLIHAVSKTNTEILDEVLKDAKSQGYVFELLK